MLDSRTLSALKCLITLGRLSIAEINFWWWYIYGDFKIYLWRNYVCIGSYIIVLPISCMSIADEISKNEYTKYNKYYSHLHIEFYAAWICF